MYEKLYCSNNLDIDYDKDTDKLRFSWFENNHYQDEQIVDAETLLECIHRIKEGESE